MAHFMLLCLQIEQVILGGIHLDGHPLHNLHAKVRKLVHLVGIVG